MQSDKVIIQGVIGSASKPFQKTFKNEAAMEKWLNKPENEGNVEVYRYSYTKD